MSLVTTKYEIEYPESDGQPMGETDLHRDWMFRILELFRWRYRGQRVYMASDLLLYYQEGRPTEFVVPDDFVVLDCDPGRRRTFKIWEEGCVPNVVIEVTSRSSKREDSIFKPRTYARIGVPEYFVFDPEADYLTPPLQGHRMTEPGVYTSIEPDDTGALECRELQLRLRLEEGELVFYDAATGQRLLTEAEAEHAAAEVQRAAAETERAARQAAEAELRRLREQIEREGGTGE